MQWLGEPLEIQRADLRVCQADRRRFWLVGRMRIGSRIKGLLAGAISSWTDDRVKARADWLRSVGEF
jgi:hypothetical protein